jgi:hypothetical protein
MTEISIFLIIIIIIIIQSSETVRALPQEKLIFPAIKTIAYKLTEKEKN